MSGIDFDIEDTLTGSDLLAEIGLHPGAIQDVIDENHAIRCPDPRDAADGDPLTVTAALTAGTERGPGRSERKGSEREDSGLSTFFNHRH